MDDLTLVIPAKQEPNSLPIVLKEIKNYRCKKIIILEKDDYETIDAIKILISKLFIRGKRLWKRNQRRN